MPNIFGKSQYDYNYLGAINDSALRDSNNALLARKGMEHNFNALRDAHNPLAVPFKDAEMHAQAIGFVTNNLQAIQAEIDEILYLDFRLDEYFPMMSNIPEGATTYSYKVSDKVGLGKFIEVDGTNANSAQVSLRNVGYALEYGGIIPKWTIEEARNAAFAGFALSTETISAGVTGAMDHIELVGLQGDATHKFTGLTNDAGIVTTASANNVASMTPDELVEFIQNNVTAIVNQTKEVFGRVVKMPMTIYAPVSQCARITELRLADDASRSVWDYVKVNNLWTRMTGNELMIKTVAEMQGAGAAGSDRMLFGFNDDRVMEMAMPIAPRVITTLDNAYSVSAPMEYKISGLNVKRPTAMRYVDNV